MGADATGKGKALYMAQRRAYWMTNSPAMESTIVQKVYSELSMNRRCLFVLQALSYEGASSV